MKVEIIPNEILIRYDGNGNVQGMHFVRTIKVIDENGNVLSNTQGNPEAVTLGIEEGLDLEAVLGDVNTANLKSIETLTNDKKELTGQLESANKSLSESENKLREAIAEIERLKSELEVSNKQLVEVNKTNEELIKNIPVTDEISEQL